MSIETIIQTKYDTNADGIVNMADVAYKLRGETIAKQIWGTNDEGNQTWLDFDISNVMLKTKYDPNGTGVKVANSSVADRLSSEIDAPCGTVYYKTASRKSILRVNWCFCWFSNEHFHLWPG